MITAIFNPDSTTANACGLWQYDYGQTLRIQGLHLPSMVEIHFSLHETGGTSVMRVGVTKDGVTDVVIPDSMLKNDGATFNYAIYAFVYLTDATSGQTEYKIKLQVKSRPEPEVPGGGEDPDIFHEAVRKVKESADKAAESERQAEGWAHGREDLPERAEDNAKYYAGQTAEDAKKTGADRKEVERLVESVSGIDEQVEKVEELTKQAQGAADKAGEAEQASKEAQKLAESAKTNAETAASKAAEDRIEVENAKTEVMQAKESISSDRTAVESAKQEIDQLKDDIPTAVQNGVQKVNDARDVAIGEINKTGTAHKAAVEDAATKALQDVENVKQEATQAVETAKSEAVQAVQTEGTTQTGNVTAEGAKQVQAVKTAAQEIVTDREQIKTNKADIADLRQNKAGAVIETASGEMIQAEDSAAATFEGISLFGKSKQITTTGVQLFDYRKAKEMYVIDCTTGQEANYGNGWLCSDFIQVDGNATYSINNQGEYSNAGIGFYDSDKNFINGVKSNDNGKFNTPSQISFVRVTFWIAESTAAECMLNKGETILPLEPYTGSKPSPSIEYPQEIENSGDSGEIGVDVSGSNLFDVSKIEDTWNGRYGIKNNNGVLTMTSASSDSTITTRKTMKELCPQLKVGETYVFSANNSGTRKAIYLYNLGLYEYDNPIVITNEILNSELRFYISGKVNDSGTIKNIQVNKGKVALPYEPYRPLQQLTIPTPNGLPGIKVDSGGNYTDSTGQQWVCDEIDLERGKYVQRVGVIEDYTNEQINSAFMSTTGGLTPGAKVIYALEKPIETDLPPEVIETYKQLHTNYPTTVVTNDSDAGMEVGYVADTKNYIAIKIETPLQKQITDLQNALISQKISGGGIKVTDSANLPILGIKVFGKSVQNGMPSPDAPALIKSVGDEGKIAVRIEGDAEPEFLTLLTKNGMPGIRVKSGGNYTDETGQQWVCDEIDLARGKYVQRMAQVTITSDIGSHSVGAHANGNKYLSISDIPTGNTVANSEIICDRYIGSMWTDENGCIYSPNGTFIINDNRFIDLNEAKRILDKEQPKIVYRLTSSSEHDLDLEEIERYRKLCTYDGTTVVSNDAGAGMELTYTVDTKTYVDAKIADISRVVIAQKGF